MKKRVISVLIIGVLTLIVGCGAKENVNSELANVPQVAEEPKADTEEFTVKFVDYDDTVITSTKYKAGTTITTPKNPDAKTIDGKECRFASWDPRVSIVCKEDATYKAKYEAITPTPTPTPSPEPTKTDTEIDTDEYTIEDILPTVKYNNDKLKVESAITPFQAKEYIGKECSVCGIIEDVGTSEGKNGTTYFLNMGKPYPEEGHFYICVFQNVADMFKTNIMTLKGHTVLISGKIEKYNNQPEIVLNSPDQLLNVKTGERYEIDSKPKSSGRQLTEKELEEVSGMTKEEREEVQREAEEAAYEDWMREMDREFYNNFDYSSEVW